MVMKTSEILRAAAERVQRGWTKGTYYDYGTDTVCAIGALTQAALGESGRSMGDYEVMRHSSSAERLNAVVREQYADRVDPNIVHPEPVICFNDHPDTTRDEVIAVFEKAAIQAEEAGE